MMGGIIGGRNTRVVWTAHAATQTNQSTFTFAGAAFGEASPRRWIIAAFRCTNLTTNFSAPHACSIGGVSATLAFQDPSGTALGHRQFWIAKVPTGTSGTITVSRAANMTGQVMNVWAAYDLKSATAVGAVASTFANPSSVSLTCQAGGIAVAQADGTSPTGWSWTGLTENVEGSAGTLGYSAASLSKTAAGALSITANGGVSNTMIAASWR